MTFEKKLVRIKEIVEKLETPDTLELDASLLLFEEGVGLVRECRELLEKAEVRVQNVSQDEQSEIGGKPIDDSENGV